MPVLLVLTTVSWRSSWVCHIAQEASRAVGKAWEDSLSICRFCCAIKYYDIGRSPAREPDRVGCLSVSVRYRENWIPYLRLCCGLQ
jgi:hypothetical protein